MLCSDGDKVTLAHQVNLCDNIVEGRVCQVWEEEGARKESHDVDPSGLSALRPYQQYSKYLWRKSRLVQDSMIWEKVMYQQDRIEMAWVRRHGDRAQLTASGGGSLGEVVRDVTPNWVSPDSRWEGAPL